MTIKTSVFSQTGTDLIINAVKKQRADGFVNTNFKGEGYEFVGKTTVEGEPERPAGDNLYLYRKAGAQLEGTLVESETAGTGTAVNAETGVETQGGQPLPPIDNPDGELKPPADEVPPTETPATAPERRLNETKDGEKKRTFVVEAASREEAEKIAADYLDEYEYDREPRGTTGKHRFRLIETTMECQRKMTDACRNRDGIFEPKEWNKRQNYRVCTDCQNELNKPYRKTKAATTTA